MANKKNRWFLPTNTDNLKMIIAQGLITSWDGFPPEKYYCDELKNYPGYIPLFKNTIPDKTLKLVVREEHGMVACLIEIDLKTIEKIENIKDTESSVLKLLAPLPLSCITQIIFKSNKDKIDLENDQKTSSNFILADLKLHYSKADEKLFETQLPLVQSDNSEDKKEFIKNHNDSCIDNIKINYPEVYAFGGLLTNLFYFAKNGKKSDEIYQLFLNRQAEQMNQDILSVYLYFFANTQISENNLQRMYKLLIDELLIDKPVSSDYFKNSVIALLERDTWDSRFKERTVELAQKLKAFENNYKKVSTWFEQANSPFERLLFILFHRDNSDGLWGYHLDFFTEEDYLLFALLFGIRDKFIKMPKSLRLYQGLQNFISFKMAEFTHEKHKKNGRSDFLTFKTPIMPKTIYSLIKIINKKTLIDLKLSGCINTIMKGDYQQKAGKAIYSGFIEPKYEIIEHELFKIMSTKNIDDQQYNKLIKNKS